MVVEKYIGTRDRKSLLQVNTEFVEISVECENQIHLLSATRPVFSGQAHFGLLSPGPFPFSLSFLSQDYNGLVHTLYGHLS